jgi:hypothetical protein
MKRIMLLLYFSNATKLRMRCLNKNKQIVYYDRILGEQF